MCPGEGRKQCEGGSELGRNGVSWEEGCKLSNISVHFYLTRFVQKIKSNGGWMKAHCYDQKEIVDCSF